MALASLTPAQRAEIDALERRLDDPVEMAEWGSGGRWIRRPHLDLIMGKAWEATHRPIRLIISTPPRHGKTMALSGWLPLSFLAAFPDKRVIHTSYESHFAQRVGSRRVRDQLTRLGDELGVRPAGGANASQSEWRTEVRRAGCWEVTDEGGMISVGMGGSITGRGGDLIIVDDPLKNAQDAYSPTIRANHIDWWQSTLSTRVEPGGSVIIIMTRWHEGDLAGYLIDEEGALEGWEVLNLPALALADDPLGRDPGEALWAERFSREQLERTRTRLGEYWWNALYQGGPQVGDGAVFRRCDFRYAEVVGSYVMLKDPDHPEPKPVGVDALRFVLAADTAMKIQHHNDWTVIVVLAITPQGDVIVWDVHRARIAVPDQWPAIKRMIHKHRPHRSGVEVKASGIGIVELARRQGYKLVEIPADVDKGLRAQPVADAYQEGRVYHMQRAGWLAQFERELTGFPAAAHDDQVDALAHAFNLALGGLGSRVPPRLPDGGDRIPVIRY